jgi:hypothetical protein
MKFCVNIITSWRTITNIYIYMYESHKFSSDRSCFPNKAEHASKNKRAKHTIKTVSCWHMIFMCFVQFIQLQTVWLYMCHMLCDMRVCIMLSRLHFMYSLCTLKTYYQTITLFIENYEMPSTKDRLIYGITKWLCKIRVRQGTLLEVVLCWSRLSKALPNGANALWCDWCLLLSNNISVRFLQAECTNDKSNPFVCTDSMSEIAKHTKIYWENIIVCEKLSMKHIQISVDVSLCRYTPTVLTFRLRYEYQHIRRRQMSCNQLCSNHRILICSVSVVQLEHESSIHVYIYCGALYMHWHVLIIIILFWLVSI